MRHPLCMLGRHLWRTEYDRQFEPYEVCGRPRCRRYRNDGSTQVFGRDLGPPAGGGVSAG